MDIADRLLAFASIDPVPVCWIEDHEGFDPSEDLCFECAEQNLAGSTQFICVSSCPPESDGCRHCETCGQMLAYILTDYGADNEFAHFRDNPPEAPLSREEAFHIARMVGAKPDAPPDCCHWTGGRRPSSGESPMTPPPDAKRIADAAFPEMS